MKIKYDLSAVEILRLFGYNKPVGKEHLEKIKQEMHIDLPKKYSEFMEVAMDCPLFGTADIWVGEMIPFAMMPRFFYDRIEERIKADMPYWMEHPEKHEDNRYYQFSKIPKEQWEEKVCNFLEIGSDYGGGVVTFGIRIQDLQEDDPPVYLQHEANDLTEWSIAYEKLSDYLLETLLNVLELSDYDTAEEVLEENGWEYEEYFDEEEDEFFATEEILVQKGIELSRLNKKNCNSGGEAFCCYDEEKNVFYVGKIEDEEISLYIILKSDSSV